MLHTLKGFTSLLVSYMMLNRIDELILAIVLLEMLKPAIMFMIIVDISIIHKRHVSVKQKEMKKTKDELEREVPKEYSIFERNETNLFFL